MCSLGTSARLFFIMRSTWKRLGVKSLFGKSHPGRTSQRGPTYTLGLRGIWAQCVVFQEYVFLRHGAWLAMHPLGINNQVRCSLIHSRSFIRVLRRGVFASSHSNAVSALEVREHPRLWRRMTLASVCLLYIGMREHPRLFIGASNYSSTSSSLR